jgi:hypothetical protein
METSGKDRGHHGGRKRHRAGTALALYVDGVSVVLGAPPRDAGRDGRARESIAAEDACAANRTDDRPSIDRIIVRHGEGDLWPDRSSVQ